jgi:transcriptional regulator of acetoin/glycerol metabolism
MDGITPDAVAALSAYRWPGNVRELRNVVERMVVLSRGDRLTVRDIPAAIRTELPADMAGAVPKGGALSLEDSERTMIVRALRNHDGNVTKAAVDLGISRRTLHRKLNEYGLRETKTG